jgi:Domain of unknown function (DUF6484)
MRSNDTTVAVLPDRVSGPIFDPAAAHTATIISITADAIPEIQLDPGGPAVPARLAVPATRARIEAAIANCQQTIVLFENGDRTKPIIVGFVETLQPDPPAAEGLPIIEADVDGKRVRVTAQDEIVLQCGSASVTLRRNGRVIIRGTYVESRSDGTNRIKGGQVQIN